MPSAAVKLRGHHLLCMLSYIGKGYTPEFAANFDLIVDRLNAGEEILVVEGLDDICAAMHDANGATCAGGEHCLEDSPAQRDRTALAAVGAALNLPIAAGFTLRLNASHYAHLRNLFAGGVLRGACRGCEWHDLCSGIAGAGFKEVRLMPQSVPPCDGEHANA